MIPKLLKQESGFEQIKTKKMKTSILLLLAFLSLNIVAQSQCVSCTNPTAVEGASVIGPNNSAEGAGSIAIGTDVYTTSAGTNTIAIGGMVKSDGQYTFVLGTGGQPLDGKRLVNSYPETLMIGFNSTKPTLFVSTSETNFGFTKTGRIAIGNVVNQNGQMDPQAKLHLRADDGEAAAVFIQSHSWINGDTASLVLGNTEHGISANTAAGLVFRTKKYYLFNSGLIGINTTRPTYDLDVKGSIFAEHFTLFNEQSPPREGSILQCDKGGNAYWNDPTGLYLWQLNENNEDIYYTTGNVSIGTDQAFPDYKLAVNGKIISEEVTVKDFNNWPDFVFGDNYQLESLKSIENYINKNNHLPGVPTALEVKKEGINLGEMNAVLLQKIEELTLYTIEQQEMLEKQFEMIESQQKQIDELSRIVNN